MVKIALIGHCTFFPPFFRFGYEMLLLIEFFCWIGLGLIHFCSGFLDSLSKLFFLNIKYDFIILKDLILV